MENLSCFMSIFSQLSAPFFNSLALENLFQHFPLFKRQLVRCVQCNFQSHHEDIQN